nr:helix-turn-helix domain-containing protein [uncultured Desulfobulbus sp.]
MNSDRHAAIVTSTVGEQLKCMRQHLKLSFEDVMDKTRISRANLRAIETSRYNKLPADAYTKGLIRIYANHLGLDGEALGQQFLQERSSQKALLHSSTKRGQAQPALEPNKMAKQARVSSAMAATCLLACIVISFTGFCLYFNWNPFSYLTDKTLVLPHSVNSNFHPADPTTSGIRAQNRLNLQAVFYKDCQVQVILDDQPPSAHAYMKGATIQWEAHQSMQLVFWGANCAELQYNGTVLPPPVFHQGRATLRLPPPVHGP